MSNFFRAFGDAFKSLKRNFSVTIASIATVFATILIFGVFLMLALTVNSLVKNVEEQIQVRIYMVENFTQTQKTNLEKKISNQVGIKEIIFETRQEAFKNAQESLGSEFNYLQGFDPVNKNPFPDSFIVSLDKPEYIDKFIEAVGKEPGVESIGNDSDTVNKIINWGKTIRTVGFIIFGVLVLVSLFLIGNTIKLAVYGRRREIEIMKFVGATNWYIRWPFIIEGIMIGLAGALLAVGALYVGYRYAYVQAHIAIPFITLPDPSVIKYWLSWEFAVAGIIIGAAGSFLSIRKHLKV